VGQSQIFNGDLEVEEGQILRGEVSVYSGDVEVREGGLIEGNLNVYSGDVEIEEGGRVNGDVTAWSGDMQIDGQVGGDVTSMAGDIEIGDSAFVGGNISVLAGQVKQLAGAEVGGNVLRGRDIKLPSPPAIGLLPWLNTPNAPAAPTQAGRDGFMNQPMGFMGRTLTGLLLLGLFVAGAAAVAAFRPRWTGEVQGVLQRQAALSFATGLIANVLMLAVIGFLYITICLRPPGLLLAVGLLAFNVAGMAVVGAELGGRLSERLSGQWTQTSRTALGVFVPGAIIVFLWAIGGCLGFFGNMGALLLGSFGVGSILVKALNLGAGTPAGGQMAPSVAPVAPAPAAPATETGSGDFPPISTPSADASPEVPPAADVRTAEVPVIEVPVMDVPVTEAPVTEAVVTEVSVTESPVAEAPAVETLAPAVPAADLPAPEAPGATPEQWWVSATDLVHQAKPPVAAGQDDFTRIEGIGPKLSQRLHAANVHTFADLAALPPETAAGVLGWTSERLLRARILEQARDLAR
jgi:predicted flap endonuclease-1-like 5' DNA nuclease/cytoskeletal protein CcmA (bactofilin family)